MRLTSRMAAITAMLLAGAVGGGFVPIREPEPEPDDEPEQTDDEPDVERPIASVTPARTTNGFGARAERRRQARTAQRGAR